MMRSLIQRFLRKTKGYGKAESGVAVVEFALVIFPVLVIMLFAIEIGARFIITSNLHSGATAIMRFVQNWPRDGAGFGPSQSQYSASSNVTISPDADLLAYACAEMGYILPCNENVLSFEIRPNGAGFSIQLTYAWTPLVPAPSAISRVVFPQDVKTPWLFVIPRGLSVS